MSATRLLVAGLLLVSLALVVLGGRRAISAGSRLEDAQQRLRAATEASVEIQRLRATSSDVPLGRQPDAGLVSTVSAVLVEAGVPSTVLTSFSAGLDATFSAPGSDASTPPSSDHRVRVRSQSARLVLEGVSLPDVGRVLARWRAAQPRWVPTSIELTPLPGSSQRPSSTTPMPALLRASITIESMYLDDSTERAGANTSARTHGASSLLFPLGAQHSFTGVSS